MKPLRSADPSPRSVQFSHFGVLNDGSNSKSALFGSAILNGTVLLLAIIVSAAAVNKVADHKDKLAVLIEPIKEQPKPPPPKLPPPPKPLPEPPKPIEPPKIQPPVPLPPEVKPVVVPTPKVNLAPPAPKLVNPPPAPKVVSLAMKASAASVPNHDANPSPVRLGMNSPVNPTGPAVARVNMNNGFAGMPPSNSGSGKPTAVRIQGNGAPTGTDLNGRTAAVVPVKGLSTGVPGGTGTGTHGPVVVQFGQQPQQVAANHPPVVAPMAHPPQITYTPRPVYTAEATSLHLEGEARVSVRLDANGSVQVLGLIHGLGHGLDQSALAAAQGIRFKPATDANGHPVDFSTQVIIRFAIN